MDITTTSSPLNPPRRTSTTRSSSPRPRPRTVLARLLSPWLDPRLARGVTPDAGALVTARAADLVSPESRHALADGWDQVLVRAEEADVLVDSRIPLARTEVRAARGEIAELVAVLRSSAPVPARELARARLLLTDGTGPVYEAGGDLFWQVAGLLADVGRRW